MALAIKLEDPRKGIISPVGIMPSGKNNQKLYRALWDTGAGSSIISNKVLDELGLIPVGKSKAGFITDGIWKVSTMLEYSIDLVVSDTLKFKNVLVNATDIPEFDILIGMDILSQGDFSYYKDIVSSETIFTFRKSTPAPNLS